MRTGYSPANVFENRLTGERTGKPRASSLLIVVTMSLATAVFARAQTRTLSVLYTFRGGDDGGNPTESPLTQDDAGTLFGTVGSGGGPACDCGAVYRVVPSTHAESVLYAFPGTPNGAAPEASVLRDLRGDFYGTTFSGGPNVITGIVYRMSPSGVETVLHVFDDVTPDGYQPQAGLVGDSAGNLFGTTLSGGVFGFGTVFQMDPAGAYTALYSFGSDPEDGILPNSDMILDAAGNLYGTTSRGLVNQGTIFKLSPTGAETILHSFEGGSNDGAYPESSALVADGEGNLYGVTQYGGTSDRGVVYKLGRGETFSVLYSFTGGADGGFPEGKLFLDAATGDLFGTATEGGNSSGICASQYPGGCGVLFKVDSATGKETVLYSFSGKGDGFMPASGLIGRQVSGSEADNTGSYELFGTTVFGGDIEGGTLGFGTVFRLTITP
jgi:uncharacterized repeat protein (TIGR03803 family)